MEAVTDDLLIAVVIGKTRLAVHTGSNRVLSYHHMELFWRERCYRADLMR